MNPITLAKNQNAMNLRELELGYTETSSSWHRQYKDSAWIYIGGLNYDLTEGDVISVFSQYGEIVNINLVRDQVTGRSKGFAFICYEDQRSTVLATDNLNGIKLVGRIIRVDHVEKYRIPKVGTISTFDDPIKGSKGRKRDKTMDEVASFVRERGCGPEQMKQLKKLEKLEKLKNDDADNKRQQSGRSTVRNSAPESLSPPRPTRRVQVKRDSHSPSPPRASHRLSIKRESRSPSPPRPGPRALAPCHRVSKQPSRPIDQLPVIIKQEPMTPRSESWVKSPDRSSNGLPRQRLRQRREPSASPPRVVRHRPGRSRSPADRVDRNRAPRMDRPRNRSPHQS